MKSTVIAEKISTLRHDRGWSQEELAKRASLSRVRIVKFEQGEMPSKSSLKKLAEGFELELDYFDPFFVATPVVRGPRGKNKTSPDAKKERQKLVSVLNLPESDRETVFRIIDAMLDKQKAIESYERAKMMFNILRKTDVHTSLI